MKLYKGSTRACLCVGSIAIKFPKPLTWTTFLRGLLGNISEYNVWKTHKEVRLLCPIYFRCPGGFFIIMERAMHISDITHTYCNDYVERTCQTEHIPCDNKTENIGAIFNLEGSSRYVLVDYAEKL